MSKIKNLAVLQDLLEVQCQDGNWDHSPYMHGMANGMIFAMSVLTGDDPEFLDPPENFLCDLNSLDKFNKSSIIVDTNTTSSKDDETD